MNQYIQEGVPEVGSASPYGVNPAVFPLQPIDEPRKEVDQTYALGCPCLCGFKLDFVTSFPLTGGAFIFGIGCRG